MELPVLRERLVLRFIGYAGSAVATMGLGLSSDALIAAALPGSFGGTPLYKHVFVPAGAALFVIGAVVAFVARRLAVSPSAARAASCLSRAQGFTLAATSTVAVAWMWLGLGALVSLCGDGVRLLSPVGGMAAFLRTPETAALLLLPLAGASVVPALQLAAALAFSGGAAAVAFSSLRPGSRVVHAFLLCLVLECALMGAASFAGARAHALLAPLEARLRGGDVIHIPMTQRHLALDVLGRYDAVIGSSAGTLQLVLLAHLLWLPILLAIRIANGMGNAEQQTATVGAGHPQPQETAWVSTPRPAAMTRDSRLVQSPTGLSSAPPPAEASDGAEARRRLLAQASRTLQTNAAAAPPQRTLLNALLLAGAAMLLLYAVLGPRVLGPLPQMLGMR